MEDKAPDLPNGIFRTKSKKSHLRKASIHSSSHESSKKARTALLFDYSHSLFISYLSHLEKMLQTLNFKLTFALRILVLIVKLWVCSLPIFVVLCPKASSIQPTSDIPSTNKQTSQFQSNVEVTNFDSRRY